MDVERNYSYDDVEQTNELQEDKVKTFNVIANKEF